MSTEFSIPQREFFKNQLSWIKQATEQAGQKRVIILGDFNLNEEMKYKPEHSHKAYYEDFMSTFDLIQLVNFETWRRLVTGNWRTSIIDHVYTNDS